MSAERIVGGLLALAMLIAWARLALWHRASPSRAWRIAALAILQPVCAALLYLTLFPPSIAVPAATLTIATAGAPRAADIVLPEASPRPTDPDLATALRRRPGTRAIIVTGNGLTPRDIDAARGLAVAFDPAPLKPGITALAPPARTAPGAPFTISGQLAALPNAVVELIDPAGRVTDRQKSDAQGRFALTGTTRAAGLVTFRVRTPGHQADVPIIVQDSPAPRLLIMAGAPGPEVKYLRRWAIDAGFAVTTMTSAGGGIALGDTPVAITPASLRRFDAAIVDDRSWAGQRGALIAATRDGLGLLLRPSGPIDAATRAQWQALGFALTGGNMPAPIALPAEKDAAIARTRRGIPGADAPDMAADILPDISRLGQIPGGSDSVPLIRDAAGTPLAAWRAIGSGRVALFTPLDSYALTLTGRRELYGDWWSAILSAIARPIPTPPPALTAPAWVGERMALCDAARVTQPSGRTIALTPDPAARNCAAFWPGAPGWHLANGTAPFYVQPANALPGVRATRDRQATLLLRATTPDALTTTRKAPGSPWPWCLAWLAASALLWWLERARAGKSPPAPAA